MSVVQFQSTKEFVCMLAMYKQAGAWLLPEWKQNYDFSVPLTDLIYAELEI